MHRCARLAATTCFVAKCQDALVDPVLGTTRQPTGSIKPAPQPTHPAVSHLPAQRIRNGFRRPSGYGKALPGDRLGQLRDARRSVVQQMHRYYIPKFDPPQLHRVVHHRTVACRSDSARSRTPLVARRRAHRQRQLCGYGCDKQRDILPAITVANFTLQPPLNRNIVTFANVVLIACSVARTNFPIRKVLRF
jgi:hypothetical protein